MTASESPSPTPTAPTISVKRPSFQFYAGDWRRDTALQSCSLEARGLWIEMITIMHDGEPYGHLTAGGMPIHEDILAKMVGASVRRVNRLLIELRSRNIFGLTSDGVIYSRRMVRDEEIRKKKAAGGAKSLENPNVPRPKHVREDGPKDGRKDALAGSIGGSSGGSFDPSPAVAVASASAGRSSSSSPVGDVGECSAGERDVLSLLESDADRAALTAVLRGARNRVPAALAIRAIAMGNDPAIPKPTLAQLGRALRDFHTNGQPWGAALFRKYIVRAVQEDDHVGQNGNGRSTRSKVAGGGARNDDVLRRFAEEDG